MWCNTSVRIPFIFFLISPDKAVNNNNLEGVFKNPWYASSADRWRIGDFSDENVYRLAPELITYWKDK
jgi:hypothetical protein